METVLSFQDATFEYEHKRPILKEANFSVRRGSKVALMGQNGAGKSTLFKLILNELSLDEGMIHKAPRVSIACAKQVLPKESLEKTVREFFESLFREKVYDIDPRIDQVLGVVNFSVSHDAFLKDLSGGQQARILLASAVIQKPDILLLDEPTNNLDKEGIESLTKFLRDYKGTCIVISHDAHFLNQFTSGVLYLNVFTHTVDQFEGTYDDAVEAVAAQVLSEERKNAQIQKTVRAKREQANKFANKAGSKIRLISKQLREAADKIEEEMVDVKKDDRTIRKFTVPVQDDIAGTILAISSFEILQNGKHITKKANVELKRNKHLLIRGPNGIGKTTLINRLVTGNFPGLTLQEGVEVGYYGQDFSTLDYEQTVFESLNSVMKEKNEERLRSVAATFLLDANFISARVGALSEGQKGLLSFARFVLQKPGLLILDEPSNHINFRHLPIIAEAVSAYKGALVIVSHDQEFLKKVRIDEILDLV